MDCVLGLDIGTTSTIGILVDPPNRRIVATASRPVTLSAPHPGWAEEDPAQWWTNVCAIVRELLGAAPGSRVAAVGVAGMVPALILLDRDGHCLRPSIQQSDGRCEREVAEIAARIAEPEFLGMTGNGINQQLILAKLRWIARHEPDTLARLATIMGSYDYIGFRLTGQRRIERNWALEGGLVDLATGTVSPRLCSLGGIDPAWLPPLVGSTEIAGLVTPSAAAATGLAPGTPVIGGVADHVASAYAAGVNAPGTVLLKFGGAGDVLASASAARPDRRLFLDYHAIPGRFMPNGCMASTGSLLNWVAATLCAHEEGAARAAGRRLHAHLDELAAAVPPGCEGLVMLPYFLGEKSPIHDPQARGVLAGLSLGHGVGHIWRAALEGTGYAFRHHVEVFAELGHAPDRLLASDGGSCSPVWMQIVADLHGRPVQVLSGHPGSCLGSAWLAAIGAGFGVDYDGVADFVSLGRLHEPDVTLGPLYDEGYARFRDLYRRLASWFAARD
ncbi:MAG: FGGY-family carbohydrate kinase [Rhodobacteraceae bacterium]|nr:FGGY-family carbohydrate kinase [Paracoccaceae bacterium]